MIHYWIFQGTPDQFRIRDRFQQGHLRITDWRVKQHVDRVKEGDRAFVWACKGKEPDAALCGFMEILCDPICMHTLSYEMPFFQIAVHDSGSMN